MSVNTETASAQGQTTVLEKEGVYASLFEKINLTPASSLGDINAFLDDAALSDAPAGERLTAAMQVFMDCIRKSGQPVEKLDKTLIDHHIAELDFQISRQLDAVMHHHEFQKVESLWRGLKQLVDSTDYRQNVKTEILDVSKEDLRQDFEDAPELIQSGLYWHTYTAEYDTPGGEPIGSVISSYEFDASPQDVALLRNISKVSAAAHMPFIGSVGPKFFLKDSMEEVAAIKDIGNYFDRAEYIKWKSFRDTDDARYIGLVMPRVLGRLPYGPDTVRDATAAHLKQQLQAFVNLPPASDARTQGTQRAYDVLKSYLMLARPDKAEAGWLAKNMLKAWPKRQGMSDGAWQEMAPKLLGFYAQNLPSHPEWKIKPDAGLVTTVRQILLKQIGQRNAESGLYQDMLKRVASNWPDLTLADMTGDTDASTVFSTEEVVPGMFTRQAWEEQVQDAIDEVVKTRRDEIDWVLTDKTHQPGSDISPEALKSRLTERYFTDFGNAWLNMVNSIQWHEAASLSDAIAQLNLIGDVRQSPLVALMNTLAWQGKTGEKGEALADSIVDSAKKLVGRKKNVKQFIEQAQGPRGPLDDVFGPLTGFMEGKEGTGRNGNLSFQSWLARVTQVRLKLQQVTSAPDPQAMSQMLAQTVFQGKAIDLTDTRDYSSLVAASLGQEWSGFGQSLFVQPLDLAWRQVLTPAAESLNTRWQTTIVDQWNKAFAGRYPFKATGSDASLPLLAQFLRGDSGRIATFLKTSLGGILHQEGNRWVVDPSASQGMEVSPDFLRAINQLAELSDIVFAQGDAGVHFELMARPSRDVARMQLTLDEQNLDFFNQMESWQSFTWPGNTYYPGVSLRWRSVNSGMQLYTSNQGNWGFIRLLDKALITPLDASRTQLVWITPDGNPLKFVMRSELGDGPLALLKLQGFMLPETIFTVVASAEDVE